VQQHCTKVDRVKIAQETILTLQILNLGFRSPVHRARSAGQRQYPQVGEPATDLSSFCVRGTSPEKQLPTGISLQNDCRGELVLKTNICCESALASDRKNQPTLEARGKLRSRGTIHYSLSSSTKRG
jgi:hypothetical protein